MSVFLLLGAFVGAMLLAGLCVALSIRVAHRWKIYDHPDLTRKSQTVPIPKLGGLAVAFVFAISTTLVVAVRGSDSTFILAIGVLIPALGAAFLGFVDDQKHLNPYARLALQAVIASTVWLTGTRINFSGNDFVDFVLTVLWIMTIVNGLNLLDNSDGLAASTALISALGAGAIAFLGGQELVAVMGFALAGAALGFLWHNWYPARVYLGDSGAYFLGFMLAVLVIRLRPEASPNWQGALIAILLVSLPLIDTTYVVIKRIRHGIHPFTAGRDHLSHRLQIAGKSVSGSVLRLQMISVVSVGLAILLARVSF